MCLVSAIGDQFGDEWKKKSIYEYPKWDEWKKMFEQPTQPTKADFDQLKQEILELKELLIQAKKFDKNNDEPNCEMEEKISTLKEVGSLVNEDLSVIFNEESSQDVSFANDQCYIAIIDNDVYKFTTLKLANDFCDRLKKYLEKRFIFPTIDIINEVTSVETKYAIFVDNMFLTFSDSYPKNSFKDSITVYDLQKK